jgi:hypothetical protein
MGRGKWLGCGVLAACTSVHAGGLDELRWLEGTWRRETARGTVHERWRITSERTFEGEAWRQSATGERTPLEDLLLVELGGEVFYIAKVAENTYPVPFKLTSRAERGFVFLNPEHDFPQEIGYELDAQGGILSVWTTGPGEGGKPRRIDFRFSRESSVPTQGQTAPVSGGP